MAIEQRLDDAFFALSDPTLRAILTRLATGEATVNELMAPSGPSLIQIRGCCGLQSTCARK